MRPLTHQDYVLILIVVAVAFAGVCAFLFGLYNLLQAIRERRTATEDPKTLPVRRRAAEGYRPSVLRH